MVIRGVGLVEQSDEITDDAQLFVSIKFSKRLNDELTIFPSLIPGRTPDACTAAHALQEADEVEWVTGLC